MDGIDSGSACGCCGGGEKTGVSGAMGAGDGDCNGDGAVCGATSGPVGMACGPTGRTGGCDATGADIGVSGGWN